MEVYIVISHYHSFTTNSTEQAFIESAPCCSVRRAIPPATNKPIYNTTNCCLCSVYAPCISISINSKLIPNNWFYCNNYCLTGH